MGMPRLDSVGPFHLHGCRPSAILNLDSPVPVIAWKSGLADSASGMATTATPLE